MRHVMLISGLAVLVIVGLGLWTDSGEVITLETQDASGQVFDTELWAVDYDGALYVRGGQTAGWVQRLRTRPDVTVQRDGLWGAYRALPSRDPAVLSGVNAAMAAKYGPPDRVFASLFERSAPIVIRLEPRAARSSTASADASAVVSSTAASSEATRGSSEGAPEVAP